MIPLMEHHPFMIMGYQPYPLCILSFTGLSTFLMQGIIYFVVYLNQRKIEFVCEGVLILRLVISSVFESMMTELLTHGLFHLHIQVLLNSFKVFMLTNHQQEAFKLNGYPVVQRFDRFILNGKKLVILYILLSLLPLFLMD